MIAIVMGYRRSRFRGPWSRCVLLLLRGLYLVLSVFATCLLFYVFLVQNFIDFFSVFMLGYAWGIFLPLVIFRSNKVHHIRFARLLVVVIEIYKFGCSLGRVCWSIFLTTYLSIVIITIIIISSTSYS